MATTTISTGMVNSSPVSFSACAFPNHPARRVPRVDVHGNGRPGDRSGRALGYKHIFIQPSPAADSARQRSHATPYGRGGARPVARCAGVRVDSWRCPQPPRRPSLPEPGWPGDGKRPGADLGARAVVAQAGRAGRPSWEAVRGVIASPVHS